MAVAKDARLDELEQRREFNVGKQVDNSKLYAGSAMYYYCKCCGAHVATKPEGWWQDPPPQTCAPCHDLISDGVIGREDWYDDWLHKNNKQKYAADA